MADEGVGGRLAPPGSGRGWGLKLSRRVVDYAAARSSCCVSTLPMPVCTRRKFVLRSKPLGHAHLAAEHAGLDAHVENRLREAEGSAPGFAVFAGLGGRGQRHVAVALLLGAALALVDGREGEASGPAARRRTCVYSGQFERDQRQRQILGTFDEASLRGFHEDAGDAGFVKGLQEGLLVRGPPVVLRAPDATSRATGGRATARTDCTSI